MPDPLAGVNLPTVNLGGGLAASSTPPELVRPISASLSAEIERMRAGIPAGRRGWIIGGVSQSGLEVGGGARVIGELTVSGYAAKLWGGGWQYGARAQWVF